MDKFAAPSSGDVTVARSAALLARGTQHLRVAANRFVRVGGNALLLADYNRDATIERNEFAWTGDNAIVLLGRTQGIDGTDGAQPRRTSVVNNLVRELGIFCKQTAAVFSALSAQVSDSLSVARFLDERVLVVRFTSAAMCSSTDRARRCASTTALAGVI